MDATSLIGNAQDAYVTGLTAQVAKKAKAAAPMASSMTPGQEKKVREAAKDFEAFFIGQMMEHMMAGIETDPMFGGGAGEDMWRSMLNQEYGKELAKSGKLGIADHVMRGMLAAQEQRDAEAATQQKPLMPTVSQRERDTSEMSAVALVAGAARPVRR